MDQQPGKTLPHDQGAERAFLGALLINPNAVNAGVAQLVDSDFFHPRHRAIFKAIAELDRDRVEVDMVTLTGRLKDRGALAEAGGQDYINELLEATPTAANLDHYARIVRDKAILRAIIRTAGEIAESAQKADQPVADIAGLAERRLFEVTDRNLTRTDQAIQPVIHDTIEMILKIKSGSLSGLPTGFIGLDKLTSGFLGGQLIVIAGRPGTGKTAFTLNMAANIALASGRPVLLFSLEMSKQELAMRMLCAEAEIDNTRLKQGMLNRRDINNLVSAADRLFKTQIVIDDKSDITINEARAKARRVKNEKKDLALIVFDYIQLAEGPPDMRKDDRYNIISDVSRSLKHLAQELNVPVVALSQLSRKIEERANRTPMLSDLRESGAIEQDADIVGFIHREFIYSKNEEDRNKASLLIEKHRNGQTGEVPLVFQGEFMRFRDRAGGG